MSWFVSKTGDQDRSRQMSLVKGEMFVNLFNMIKMTLPGTAFIYYGEEIGMVNANITEFDPAGLLNPVSTPGDDDADEDDDYDDDNDDDDDDDDDEDDYHEDYFENSDEDDNDDGRIV